MKEHYDFSKMKGIRNPYARLLKQAVTIRLDRETVEYFKTMATKTGCPYQNLINLFLRECATERKELTMKWETPPQRPARPRSASGRKRTGGNQAEPIAPKEQGSR